MATISVNGVRLFYELEGQGKIPLVLVHGGWSSHHSWDFVVPKLTNSFRVLTYDRRGHSQSERPEGQGSVLEDVADLAVLLEKLELVPAWVGGLSSGATIVLRLAAERPELFRGLVAHEPALFSLLATDPTTLPLLEDLMRNVSLIVKRITEGDSTGAAELFYESVVGSGTWSLFPQEFRARIIDNAPTFLDDVADQDALSFDPGSLARFPHPVLLTRGADSPPSFAPIVSIISKILPGAETSTLGSGHIPQFTHPDTLVKVITKFVARNSHAAKVSSDNSTLRIRSASL